MNVCCPHCHVALEVDDASSLGHITSDSCGSGFSLLGDETASHHKHQTKSLGHFELIERIGMGAFGSVWKVIDTNLDRTVAVKFPRAERLAPDEVEQFLREARAAAQMRHPNIVTIHEVGRDGDAVYIASDYVAGLTLAEAKAWESSILRKTIDFRGGVATLGLIPSLDSVGMLPIEC